MSRYKNILPLGVLVILLTSLGACNKPGPAETAGKKIDDVTEDTGRKIDEPKMEIGKDSENSEKMGEVINYAAITT